MEGTTTEGEEATGVTEVEDTMEEAVGDAEEEEVTVATAAATKVTVAAQGVVHMPEKLFRLSLVTKSI